MTYREVMPEDVNHGTLRCRKCDRSVGGVHEQDCTVGVYVAPKARWWNRLGNRLGEALGETLFGGKR